MYIEFVTFLKERYEPHSLNISEIFDSERCGYFGSQRGNRHQALLKSAGQHFYSLVSLFRDRLNYKTSRFVRS